MSKLPTVNIPDNITAIFKRGGLPRANADVKNILMAGALIDTFEDKMLPADNRYLEVVGGDLISSEDVTVSDDIAVRVANLSLDVNLFALDDNEQHDWVIFCDWLVSPLLVQKGGCEATLQSKLTFEPNSWTNAFRKAGVVGFTIVGHDFGVDRLNDLALNNNAGMTQLGEEYSFEEMGYDGMWRYRAQNYLFNSVQP